MKENSMKVLGCIPPFIPVTDDVTDDDKCPLYYMIDDEEQVTTKHM